MTARARVLQTMLQIQDQQLRRLATTSLRAFLELAWPILEPARPFTPGWHLDYLAEVLETVSRGDRSRLVINIPPRYGKSILVSVLWPVWEWIHAPGRRWMFVSHSAALATRLSEERRSVLTSPWYREHFPHVTLKPKHSRQTHFRNTENGAMLAFSMEGSMIGQGGDRMVIDDPHTPDEAERDTTRDQTEALFRRTLSTRLNDPTVSAMVLVMQRLHERDLTAVVREMGFEVVALPAVAPTRTTIVFPGSGRIVVREEGDVLWPAHQNADALTERLQTLGSYGYAAQYQQDPKPASGQYFPRDAWMFHDERPEGGGRPEFIHSWDLAFKGAEGCDYVVGLVGQRVRDHIYLVDRFKARVPFVKTSDAIQEMAKRYPPAVVLVEEAANGSAIIDSLMADIPSLIGVKPTGTKRSRAAVAQAHVERRQVSLPNPHSPEDAVRFGAHWVDDFMTSAEAFPKGAFDDDVDAFSQMLTWAQTHRHEEAAGLAFDPEPILRPRPSEWLFGARPRSFGPLRHGMPQHRRREWQHWNHLE